MPSQLGWRLPNADEVLFEPLFRRGYEEHLHILPHGEVTSKWISFVDNLYETEEGFIGKEKKSVKSVKEQWDLKIRRFKEKFGWLNGSVSPHLPHNDKLLLESGLYKIIHQIVYELWEHDKKKRVRGKKALMESDSFSPLPVVIPPTSTDIFDNQKKRKVSTLTVSHEVVPAASETSAAGAAASTDADGVKPEIVHWKNLRVPPESVLETRIVKRVKKESNDFTHATLMELIKIESATAEQALANFPLLINIFCSPGKNFEPEYVKSGFKDVGLGSLDAHKVYYYLNRIKNSLL